MGDGEISVERDGVTSAGVPVKSTFVRLPSRDARCRLICLPFAGGGVSAFRAWARGFPSDVEVLVAQLPARESRLREQPFDSIWDMADWLLPEIIAGGDLPYALFGHSMGGLVAYELAVALERMNERPPSSVFISARRAPDERLDEPPIADLPDREFLDALQCRYNAVPEAVRGEPELLELLLPALRADLRAIEGYTPRMVHRLACPVHVYGGLDDRRPLPSELAGWQRFARQPVRTRLFPGGHFFITSRRDDVIADIMANWMLDVAREGSRS
jgi:medium-chain acyl-[acyl-carrier-protein] hydrolase